MEWWRVSHELLHAVVFRDISGSLLALFCPTALSGMSQQKVDQADTVGRCSSLGECLLLCLPLPEGPLGVALFSQCWGDGPRPLGFPSFDPFVYVVSNAGL